MELQEQQVKQHHEILLVRRQQMDALIYGGLVVATTADRNYRSLLSRASKEQIVEAIKVMEGRNGKDKARIAACNRL